MISEKEKEARLRSALAQIQRTVDYAEQYIERNPRQGLEDVLRAITASVEFAEYTLEKGSNN